MAAGQPPDRAIFFIDGNNWYHSLREIGVPDLGRLDYGLISKKLSTPRQWLETRYYIGSLPHNHPEQPNQQRFTSGIEQQDARIKVHFGRLENRRQPNILADQLRTFLKDPNTVLGPEARHDLQTMLDSYGNLFGLKEKATDVMIAIDMCRLAWEDAYDVAYLLSADGDYTPAVDLVKGFGKSVFAVSPSPAVLWPLASGVTSA